MKERAHYLEFIKWFIIKNDDTEINFMRELIISIYTLVGTMIKATLCRSIEFIERGKNPNREFWKDINTLFVIKLIFTEAVQT